jgi:GDP/UDP-N,N'-diacetylbacillosamine 2-epimerase (hydrolysing)
MKKIAAVTGSRAEYGILSSVLKAIEAHPGLRLFLVVTGMHLSHEFGYTVQDIEKDGFKIDARVDTLLSSDTPGAMAKGIGMGIIGMTQTWEQLKPDVILVLGDRVEPLAAAISGAYVNIPIAHIHGGDKSIGGHADDSIRHVITKLAHIHFPATNKSAERIIKMGEDEWRVHMVGSPALDDILGEPLLPSEVLEEKLGTSLAQPLILLVQHSVTTQVDEAAEQMRETLEAIVEIGYTTVLLYPNSDAGGRQMIEVIKEYEKYPFIKTFKSLPRKEYLSLMKLASVMVGNSSSGIIDAPSLGLPVINIGIRQEGRQRGNNVIDVGHNKQEIIAAVEKALTDEEFLAKVRKYENPYGDGKTGPRIAEILSQIEITPRLLQKKITY